MSNRLLSNRYFNKLQVNRLQANSILSNNIQPKQISYLYSILSNNSIINVNNELNYLTITIKRDHTNIIQFSDRPFRQSNDNFNFYLFAFLFLPNNSTDSFFLDPPNAVLTSNNIQQTYKVYLNGINGINTDTDTIKLKLIPLENNSIKHINNESTDISLFVDNLIIEADSDNFLVILPFPPSKELSDNEGNNIIYNYWYDLSGSSSGSFAVLSFGSSAGMGNISIPFKEIPSDKQGNNIIYNDWYNLSGSSAGSFAIDAGKNLLLPLSEDYVSSFIFDYSEFRKYIYSSCLYHEFNSIYDNINNYNNIYINDINYNIINRGRSIFNRPYILVKDESDRRFRLSFVQQKRPYVIFELYLENIQTFDRLQDILVYQISSISSSQSILNSY